MWNLFGSETESGSYRGQTVLHAERVLVVPSRLLDRRMAGLLLLLFRIDLEIIVLS